MPGLENKTPVFVELQLRSKSALSRAEAVGEAEELFSRQSELADAQEIALTPREAELFHSVRLRIPGTRGAVKAASASPVWLAHRLSSEPPCAETLGGDEALAAITVWDGLPHSDFAGAWDSLVFEDGELKDRLLATALTLLRLAQAGVSPDAVPCHRLALLHGPPGTGKTTLAKATAQQLAIRLKESYPRASLVEVNAASLFSKWFSESGKMVAALFERLEDMAQDHQCLVVVLLDEVESVCRSRASSLSGAEPSDGLRAVNAVLSRLDGLRRFPNVLTLATSNLLEALDGAFVDRADVVQECPLPPETARRDILQDSFAELQRKGLLGGDAEERASVAASVAMSTAGLSGRGLRKLPVAALAQASLRSQSEELSMEEFGRALALTAKAKHPAS